MNDIIEVVKGLPKLACVGKIENVDIVDAELQLRLNFAEEYKRYLSEFGAISARRIELTGIIGVDYCNVVTATKQAWELNPQVPHNLYVVENTFTHVHTFQYIHSIVPAYQRNRNFQYQKHRFEE